MANTYLVYNLQADADAAEKKIRYNMYMAEAAIEEGRVGDGANHYSLAQLQGMTEEQVIVLKCYGIRNGIVRHSDPGTQKWADIRERNNHDNKWCIPKPNASLMTGVQNADAEEEFDETWFAYEGVV